MSMNKFAPIQLYNEEIIDLLADERQRANSAAIKIHEDPTRHEIYLSGIASQQVNSPEDILATLRNGAVNRATAATNMNQQSSRSHAIFTIMMKQIRSSEVNDPLLQKYFLVRIISVPIACVEKNQCACEISVNSNPCENFRKKQSLFKKNKLFFENSGDSFYEISSGLLKFKILEACQNPKFFY